MNHLNGITEIIYVNDLGATPARCQRSTGKCWVSIRWWKIIPKEWRVFILLHENAHIVLNTSDEMAVDAYAHEQYMKLGYSLTASVKALTQVLSFKNPQHYWRALAQLNRARRWDFEKNHNQALKAWYMRNPSKKN